MVESHLVSRKKSIEIELKRGVRDPKRRAFLLANLLRMERDIGALGFSEDEVEKNDFSYADSKKTSIHK